MNSRYSIGPVARFSCLTALVLMGLAISLMPPPARAADPDLRWRYSRSLHQDPFQSRLTLIYGVPETDISQAIAQCRIGNSGTYATLDLAADIGTLAADTSVEDQFVGRSFDQIVAASVIRAEEEGFDGAGIALQLDDPLWQAIRAQSFLH